MKILTFAKSVFMTLIVFLISAGVSEAAEKKDSLANVHGILKRPQPKFQTAGFDNVYFQKATAMLVQEKSGKLDTSRHFFVHGPSTGEGLP